MTLGLFRTDRRISRMSEFILRTSSADIDSCKAICGDKIVIGVFSVLVRRYVEIGRVAMRCVIEGRFVFFVVVRFDGFYFYFGIVGLWGMFGFGRFLRVTIWYMNDGHVLFFVVVSL